MLSATGDNNESMTRKEWDVSGFRGELAQFVVYDNSSGGWGTPILMMSIKRMPAVKIYRGAKSLLLRHAAS